MYIKQVSSPSWSGITYAKSQITKEYQCVSIWWQPRLNLTNFVCCQSKHWFLLWWPNDQDTHFPHHCPFVQGNHWFPVDPLHKWLMMLVVSLHKWLMMLVVSLNKGVFTPMQMVAGGYNWNLQMHLPMLGGWTGTIAMIRAMAPAPILLLLPPNCKIPHSQQVAALLGNPFDVHADTASTAGAGESTFYCCATAQPSPVLLFMPLKPLSQQLNGTWNETPWCLWHHTNASAHAASCVLNLFDLGWQWSVDDWAAMAPAELGIRSLLSQWRGFPGTSIAASIPLGYNWLYRTWSNITLLHVVVSLICRVCPTLCDMDGLKSGTETSMPQYERWLQDMKMLSVLLVLCEGNPLVTMTEKKF